MRILLALGLFLVGCQATPPPPSDQATSNGGTSSNFTQPNPPPVTSEPSSDPVDQTAPHDVDVTDMVLVGSWQVVGRTGIASAFAIDSRRLATNAHVVLLLISDPTEDGVLGAVVQHNTGETRQIVGAWVHPAYDGNSTTAPDVGVLEVDEDLPGWLELANDDQLRTLGVFDELRMCGFPGDVALAIDIANLMAGATEFKPQATCLSGEVTAIRAYDPTIEATPENSQLIQHNIASTAGTSGSAIYAPDGSVVAINAATTTDEAGLNRFAPRIDTLRDLLAMIENGEIEMLVPAVDVPDEPAPSPTPTPAPPPADDPVDDPVPPKPTANAVLDGEWQISVDTTFDGLIDSLACIVVADDLLVAFFDGCEAVDILVGSAPILVDDVGPYFDVDWPAFGGPVTFFWQSTGDGLYDIEFDTGDITYFGFADPM